MVSITVFSLFRKCALVFDVLGKIPSNLPWVFLWFVCNILLQGGAPFSAWAFAYLTSDSLLHIFFPSLLVSPGIWPLLHPGTLVSVLDSKTSTLHPCLLETSSNTGKYICFLFTVEETFLIVSTKLSLEIWANEVSCVDQNPRRWDVAIRTFESSSANGLFGVLNKMCQTWRGKERKRVMEPAQRIYRKICRKYNLGSLKVMVDTTLESSQREGGDAHLNFTVTASSSLLCVSYCELGSRKGVDVPFWNYLSAEGYMYGLMFYKWKMNFLCSTRGKRKEKKGCRPVCHCMFLTQTSENDLWDPRDDKPDFTYP